MAISRIQYATAINSTSTITVTLASVPTNGDNLYACIAVEGTGQTVSSISQSGVSNWTKVVSIIDSGDQADAELWKAEGVSGASTTVTITLTGAPAYGARANVLEYSGLASNGTDKTASSSGQSSSAVTGTTTTTSHANELWLGMTASYSTGTSNPTNGFTLIDGSGTGATVCSVLEKIVSTTGTAGSGVSCNDNHWAGCIATFLASGVVPPRIPRGGVAVGGVLILGLPRPSLRIPTLPIRSF
jgi:hypothetical protein